MQHAAFSGNNKVNMAEVAGKKAGREGREIWSMPTQQFHLEYEIHSSAANLSSLSANWSQYFNQTSF